MILIAQLNQLDVKEAEVGVEKELAQMLEGEKEKLEGLQGNLSLI